MSDTPTWGGQRPRRKIGRRQDVNDPSPLPPGAVTGVAHHDGDIAVLDEPHEPVDPREDRFSELLAAGLFGLATVASLWVCVAFWVIPAHDQLGRYMNFALGGGLAIALLAAGAGFIIWAKRLIPHQTAIQERHDHHSPEADEIAAEDTFLAGVQTMQLGQRKLLRRSVLGGLLALPLPALILLKDLGPPPTTKLRQSGWKAGDRLVDVETRLPIKLGDVSIGGIRTVMPEGFDTVDDDALAPTMLIRFAPGEIRSKRELAWSKDDHVAYSKICTHAGCPISLYEQQTHHLLCPCHQSTFDMANNAKVIFGPAARNLPQLQLDLDADGYFIAKSAYKHPVGPSFWERG